MLDLKLEWETSRSSVAVWNVTREICGTAGHGSPSGSLIERHLLLGCFRQRKQLTATGKVFRINYGVNDLDRRA